MKTFRTYKNNQKNNIMNRLALLFSVLFAINATAKINNDSLYLNLDYINVISEENELEESLFVNVEDSSLENFDINSIEVIELEEEIEFDFNPKNYLPEGFNALKGKHDLDLKDLEVIEIEEEVELGFDTVKYLPENFNALKGKHDLDWSAIELVELDEEVEFNFDTNDYLPNNFNPYKGMHSNNVVACLY